MGQTKEPTSLLEELSRSLQQSCCESRYESFLHVPQQISYFQTVSGFVIFSSILSGVLPPPGACPCCCLTEVLFSLCFCETVTQSVSARRACYCDGPWCCGAFRVTEAAPRVTTDTTATRLRSSHTDELFSAQGWSRERGHFIAPVHRLGSVFLRGRKRTVKCILLLFSSGATLIIDPRVGLF